MLTKNPDVLQTSSRRFIHTQTGKEALAANDEILGLVTAFIADPAGFHRGTFNDSYEPIGRGSMSEVRLVGGYAVKLSTPTTGSLNDPSKDRKQRRLHSPEHLVNQTRFLAMLGIELGGQPDSSIVVPEQLIALNPRRKHSLQVMQFMEGWTTLYAWLEQNDIHGEDKWHATDNVRQRIDSALGGSVLRPGLNDIFRRPEFDGEEFFGNLSQDNLLIPDTTATIGDLASARICIIDQPSTSSDSGIKTWLAMRQFASQPGFVDPFVQ